MMKRISPYINTIYQHHRYRLGTIFNNILDESFKQKNRTYRETIHNPTNLTSKQLERSRFICCNPSVVRPSGEKHLITVEIQHSCRYICVRIQGGATTGKTTYIFSLSHYHRTDRELGPGPIHTWALLA